MRARAARVRSLLRSRLASPGRTYPCVIVAVHDGDTLTALADRGDGDWWFTDVRLAGGNARELKDLGGPEARTHLAELVQPITPQLLVALVSSKTVRGTLTTAGWDKFGGRVLGRIATPTTPDVMAQMIRDGYAAVWNGTGVKPVPAWPPVPPPTAGPAA